MNRPAKLQALAEFVLIVLEEYESWDDGVLEEISDKAHDLKLAELNEDGLFARVSYEQEYEPRHDLYSPGGDS